jgi:hypothetical protein
MGEDAVACGHCAQQDVRTGAMNLAGVTSNAPPCLHTEVRAVWWLDGEIRI